MVEFLEQRFSLVVHAACVIYIVLGIVLFSYKVPKTKEYAPYRISKNLLAASLWVTSINVFLWIMLFNDNWSVKNPRIACVDIIFYYLLGITFSYSITNLLDRKCITQRRCITTAITWSVTTVVTLLSLVDAFQPYRGWFLLAGLIGLVEFCVRTLLHFHKTYARSGELFDNYFSSDKRQFISWIKRSFYLLYFAAVLATVTINTGVFANWILETYIICVMIYVSISFINYAADYGALSKADTDEAEAYLDETIKRGNSRRTNLASATSRYTANDADTNKGKETRNGKNIANGEDTANDADSVKKLLPSNYEEKIKPKLDIWLDSKRFRTEQFSIDDLATRLGTNKYYLSTYIRENYNMNFSTWVASLRLQEAKRMMQENHDIRLEDVAYAVGFSSLSYFSKVFSKQEGVSPSVWLRGKTS